MTQKELIKILEDKNLVVKSHVYINKANAEVTDITYNSKQCSEGCVFFVKGANFKAEYVKDAIKNGAAVIISEKEYEVEDAGIVIVSNARLAMVYVAEEFFEKAYERFNLIGITGTKGKTTTANFVSNILREHLGYKSGLISTNEIYTGKREEESHLTTPEAIELQRCFKETSDSKIKFLTMEVSSQAYKVNRINNVKFDVGIFLNISEDHISPSEHPNFTDYLNCKLEFLKNCKTVIINRGTDYFEAVLDAAKEAEKIITFGTLEHKDFVDYYVDNVENKKGILSFEVKGSEYSEKFKTKLQGRFNIENAMAAIIVANQYNIDEEKIKEGILNTLVKGRMSIFEKNEIKIIVDYAHNKLSFEKFFESIKEDYPGRRIISIFGAPGGKAYARRKELGEIASKYSDYIYLTADDPQFEEVSNICNEIATYIEGDHKIIEDRTEAIETAFKEASSGDIIVVLAKGGDSAQKIRGNLVHYESDLNIAKRLTI